MHSDGGLTAAARCTPACPTSGEAADAWRKRWDEQLAEYVATEALGKRWKEAMAFVSPLKREQFIFNVF